MKIEKDKYVKMKKKMVLESDIFNLDCPYCKNTKEEVESLAHILFRINSSMTWLGVKIYRVQRKIDLAKEVAKNIGSSLLEIGSASSTNCNTNTTKNNIVDQHYQDP